MTYALLKENTSNKKKVQNIEDLEIRIISIKFQIQFDDKKNDFDQFKQNFQI